MTDVAQEFLAGILRRLQRNRKVRTGLAVLALSGLLGLAASFIYDALPHEYELSITGGDVLSTRHFLSRMLQREAAENGVTFRVIPMSNSLETLTALNEGKLDMAFVQGGFGRNFPNVRQVAYIGPEQLQLLARPEVADISELRLKLINLSSPQSITRIVAKEVLQFSGLNDGVDYVETNFSTEELLQMRADKLPDGIFVTSLIPSDLVEFLVKERGYNLLEIPFPEALALRFGWVADSNILAYAYNVDPPVPSRDIKTIGINMHLLARTDIDPRAVFRVLESLYSPALELPPNLKIDENDLTKSSGYLLSEGSKKFLDRKNPLLSAAILDEIEAFFGIVLTVLSSVLIAVKWFKGESSEPDEASADDLTFVSWINDVVAIEKQVEAARLQSGGTAIPPSLVGAMQSGLMRIKTAALEKVGTARLDNDQLPHVLLAAIADARASISQAARQ